MAKQSIQTDEQMMNTPDRWPQWPYLPLKRRDAHGQVREYAVLFAGKPLRVAIGANLFDLTSVPKGAWKETTAAQLVRDRWEVD
jgi:hypothetical protein